MWPSSPNFFELVNEQCDMAVKIMDGLIAYMESTDKDRGKHVSKLEKQGEALKRRNLEILNAAFSTPMDREDIYRAIVDVDHVMDYAKTTVREIYLFGVEPDNYILQMTEHLREGTTALQMGFRLLKDPVGVLLASEGCHSAVRPGVHVNAVVGRVEHDGVVGDTELIEQFEKLADVHVVLDHAV